MIYVIYNLRLQPKVISFDQQPTAGYYKDVSFCGLHYSALNELTGLVRAAFQVS